MSIYNEFSYFTGSGSWAEERPLRFDPITVTQNFVYNQATQLKRDPLTYAYQKGKQVKGFTAIVGGVTWLTNRDKGSYSKAEVVSNPNETRRAMRNESDATKAEL